MRALEGIFICLFFQENGFPFGRDDRKEDRLTRDITPSAFRQKRSCGYSALTKGTGRSAGTNQAHVLASDTWASFMDNDTPDIWNTGTCSTARCALGYMNHRLASGNKLKGWTDSVPDVYGVTFQNPSVVVLGRHREFPQKVEQEKDAMGWEG